MEAGERSPYFNLLAAGSGRRVTLRSAAERKLVLIFHLQGAATAAREINHAVCARYPSPDDVLVASVIDLSIVPLIYCGMVG